jgi:hypothetical protein
MSGREPTLLTDCDVVYVGPGPAYEAETFDVTHSITAILFVSGWGKTYGENKTHDS